MAKISYNVASLLHQTTFSWRSLLNKRLKPLGLSQAKWRALLHLFKAGKPLTQCELAISLEIEPPTVVGLIDRLAKEGWVERRVGEDRRMKTLHLTDQANAAIVEIQKIADQVQAELLKDIEPEALNACIKVLEQIRETAEHIHA